MDFEDLFKRDHHHPKRKHGYRNHENSHGRYGDQQVDNQYAKFDRDHHGDNDQDRKHGDHKYKHHNDDLFDFSHLIPRLLASKKLLITAGIVLLAVIALAVIIVLPLFGQALDFINKSGLQGVVDRLLQGTGSAK